MLILVVASLLLLFLCKFLSSRQFAILSHPSSLLLSHRPGTDGRTDEPRGAAYFLFGQEAVVVAAVANFLKVPHTHSSLRRRARSARYPGTRRTSSRGVSQENGIIVGGIYPITESFFRCRCLPRRDVDPS